ncbi:MAG: hypothetical protein P8Y99_03220 [Calditrichaceae bacterium]
MSKRYFQPVIFLSFWVFVFAASAIFAQEKSLIEVKSEVDTSTITIGDRIDYSITIDRDKDLRIMKPGEGLNLGMFEIKDYNFHDPVEKGDRLIEKYDFTISVYDTGKFTIPPFPIAYFPVDTSKEYKIIEASPIDIYVKSVISGDDAKELKDIKFPLGIPFNYFFWISMGVVVILVAVIGYLGYLLWKRRKEKGYLFSPPPPPRPAHEVALEALEELYKSSLLEEKQFKEFFSHLSDIIRVYLEGRYFFDALEETTFEIMMDAKKHIEDAALLDDLKNILELSDLIKFAKYIPEDKEIESAKEQSLNFVNETKLVYEIVEENVPEEKVPIEDETLVTTDAEETKEIKEEK